jgi:NAD(P)H dehydrogenase (quinone)
MEYLMSSIAILYHSGYGHTAAIAKAVAEGAAQVAGTQVHLVPIEEFEAHQPQIDAAQAIIFGSPTYMGAVSGPFKTFMDATAKIWYGRGWQDKLAAGFTVSASQSGDKLATLQQLTVFAAQHGMVWVSLGLLPGNNNSKGSVTDLNRLGSFLGAMAQANADEGAELTPPQSDRDTAAHLGRRVAEAALRWKQ